MNKSLLDYKHLTVDIETLGLAPGSAVVAIGARIWSRDGCKQGFEAYISEQDAMTFGEVDRGTLDWWAKQDPDVYKRVMGGRIDTATVLRAFCQFYDMHKPDFVWANSPAFDLINLQAIFRKVNLIQPTVKWPIDFRKERDSRTLRAIGEWFGIDVTACYKDMRSHQPLDDATGDAKACIQILAELEQNRKLSYDTAHPDDKSPTVHVSKLADLGGPDL